MAISGSAEEAAAKVQDSVQLFRDSSADVEVTVEGEIVMVHSVVLGMASPVFAALFLSRMKEGLTKQLALEGKSKEEFELFIDYLYPPNRRKVDLASADVLLRWADEYQVDFLKAECEELLLASPCNVARLLQARTFGLTKQYQRCLAEVPDDMLVASMDILIEDVDVLTDILPRLSQKNADRKDICQRIQTLLDTAEEPARSLKCVLPFINTCLRISMDKQNLKDGIRNLRNIGTSNVTGMGAMVQKQLLNARVEELEDIESHGHVSRSI